MKGLLARLEAGRGAVVLAGPAGVGKTRLASEVLAEADRRGFAVLRVGATPLAQELPFGAFATLLPELPAGLDRVEMLRQIAAAVVGRSREGHLALFVDDA